MQATNSGMIAELTLSWITTELRQEIERREIVRISEEVPAEFWRLQMMRLLSFSLIGVGWVVFQMTQAV